MRTETSLHDRGALSIVAGLLMLRWCLHQTPTGWKYPGGQCPLSRTVPTLECPADPVGERPKMAQSVSKLKITGFFGVSLPLPRCREADIERSNEPLFALSRNGVRFDTLWADYCQIASKVTRRSISVVQGLNGDKGITPRDIASGRDAFSPSRYAAGHCQHKDRCAVLRPLRRVKSRHVSAAALHVGAHHCIVS